MNKLKRLLSLCIIGAMLATSQGVGVSAEEQQTEIFTSEAPEEMGSFLEAEVVETELEFTLDSFAGFIEKVENSVQELEIKIKTYDKNTEFVAVIVPDYTLAESVEWANLLKSELEVYENVKIHILEEEKVQDKEYVQKEEAHIYLSFNEKFGEVTETIGLGYDSIFSVIYKDDLIAIPVITLHKYNEFPIVGDSYAYVDVLVQYYGLELSVEPIIETEMITSETEILETGISEIEISETESPVMAAATFAAPVTMSAQETRVRNFVTSLYTNILNRAGDATGIDYWTKVLVGQTGTGAHVAMMFIESPEFQAKPMSNQDYVNILYRTILNRQGEASGVVYWTSRLDYGISKKSVAAQFLTSPEFKALCSSYGIQHGTVSYSENRDKDINYTRFVIRLYEKALNREYDVAGLNYWTGRILSNLETTESVAEKFFLSPEMQRRNLSNAEYVRVLYRTFLDREADPSGNTYHVNRLNNGITRTTVLYGFSRSPEFKSVINGILSSTISGRVMESQYWSDPLVDDRTLLAAIIYTESRGEGYNGQLAVGFVVMNRMNHSAFPNSLRENIYWKNQFQPARTGVLSAVLKDTSVITATCWEAADRALAMRNQTKVIPGVTLPNGKTNFDYLYFMTPAAYERHKWPDDDTFLLRNHMFFSRVGYR